MQIAHARRRFGYRRVHDMLRPQFPGVNHKRVFRLYKAADLSVRKRRKAKRPTNERVPLQLAQRVNEVWSMDFVSDSLASGRRIRCLTVADDFTHECVDIATDHGMGGVYVTRVLDQAACFRGYPAVVRTDNGPEFTSRAFRGCLNFCVRPTETCPRRWASLATNARRGGQVGSHLTRPPW